MSKLHLTAVNYLNTKPLLFGLQSAAISEIIEIELAIPSQCAQQFAANKTDIVLLPTGALPQLSEYEIITDYCIGCEGAVKTVCVFSEVPIENISHLYLDFHSRTSVELVKILLREYWQLSPILLNTSSEKPFEIKGTHAALVIGDKTMNLEAKYIYDLGEIWQQHTGLPFVFAVWVTRKSFDKQIIAALNAAFADGVNNIQSLMETTVNPYPKFDLQQYYTKYISYFLDDKKREALQLFLTKI